MSINVTVHGNPISIKRGKMVAIDADKEFELRRRIRLQQVRQQSKEIAEEVRNRVRKEKNKQFSKLEKHSERDLKRLQERKLATLQKQYQECLEEFGAAYKDAERQPDPVQVIGKVTERNRDIAEFRGKSATEKRKEEKEQQEKQSRKYIDNKREVRTIENVRSKLVSDIQKNKNKKSPFHSKRKKNCIADIRINGLTAVLTDDSDDEYGSEMENLSVLDGLSPGQQTPVSASVSLDSEGNSVYSTGNESTKENDIRDQNIDNNRCFNMYDEKSNSKSYKSSKQSNKTEKRNEKNTLTSDKLVEESLQDKESYRSHKNAFSPYQTHGDIGLFLQPTRSVHKIHKPLNIDVANQKSPISTRIKQFVKEYEHQNNRSSKFEHDVDEEMSNWHEDDQVDNGRLQSSRPQTSRLTERVKKSLEKDVEQEPVLEISSSSSHFQNNRNEANDEIYTYRRLQSGLDEVERSGPYLRKTIGFCDESNCPVFVKDKKSPKTKNKSVKSAKKGKTNKNVYNPKPPSLRKTIRSLKTPDKSKSIKDSKNSSETAFINNKSEAGDNRVRSPTRCIWPNNPTCKRASPKKNKSPNRMTQTVCFCPHNKENHLPYVPKMAIEGEHSDTQDSTVRYYDHFNRFQKEANQPTLVQKISEESLKVYPPSDDEEKYTEQMKRRDEEAKIRGNRALEKNKIHRDYQQLMEELPVLQRQERLAAMASHNPAYHMSEERYKEFERKKQNRMENIFESLNANPVSVDTPIITIKSVRKSPPSSEMKQPFKTLDISENNAPVLNVGRWENVESSMSSTTQISRDETPTDESVDKEQALKALLKRVNKQREILLKEAANLPSLSGIKNVLKEDELFELLGKTQPQTRVLVETGTSPLVTKESEVTKKSKKIRPVSSKTSSKRTASTTSSSDTSVETLKQKTKKGKVHKKIKVLIKEEATQTTPTIARCEEITTKGTEEEKREEGTQTSPCCPNAGGKSCFCPKDKSLQATIDRPDGVAQITQFPSSSDSEKVCEIIIKPSEDSSVQISSTPFSTTEKLSTRTAISDRSVYRIGQQKTPVVQIKIKESDNKLVNEEFIPRNMIETGTNTRNVTEISTSTRNIMEMSTSTSYMSPPTDSGRRIEQKSVYTSTAPISDTSTNKDLLYKSQKQQTNLDSLVKLEQGAKEVNPRLIKYIKRLLSMSRQSIDELTISSVSDVSTPHESIVQTASNLAREKLQCVMDHFNLSYDDIKKYYLSSSSFSTSNMSTDSTPEQSSNKTCPGAIQTQKSCQSVKPSVSQETYEEKFVCTIGPKQFISVSTSTDLEEPVKQTRPKVLEQTRPTTVRIENDRYVSESQPQIDKSRSHSVERSTSPILCIGSKQKTTRRDSIESTTSSLKAKDYQRVKAKSPKRVSINPQAPEVPSTSTGYQGNHPKYPSVISDETSTTTTYQQIRSASPTGELSVSTAYQDVASRSPRVEPLKPAVQQGAYSRSVSKEPDEPSISSAYQRVQTESPSNISEEPTAPPAYQRVQSRSPQRVQTRSPDRVVEEQIPSTSYQRTHSRSPVRTFDGPSTSYDCHGIPSRSPTRMVCEPSTSHAFQGTDSTSPNQVGELKIPCAYRVPSSSTGYQEIYPTSPHRMPAQPSTSTSYQRTGFRSESPNTGSIDPSTSTDYHQMHSKATRGVSFEVSTSKKLCQPYQTFPRETKHSSSSTGKEVSTSSDTEPQVVICPRSPRQISTDSMENEKYYCVSKQKDPNRTYDKQMASVEEREKYGEYSYSTVLPPRSPKKDIHEPSISGMKKQISPKRGAQKQKVSSKALSPKPGSSPPRNSTELKVPVSPEAILSNEEQQENFLQFVRDSLGMSVEEFTELGFEEMFTRHMQLTEYCHDRIRSLMDLIEKVRNEKRKIFTPSPVDQSVTSYLELPQAKPATTQDNTSKTAEDAEKDYSTGSASSLSQGTVDEYLLGLDPNDTRIDKYRKHVMYKTHTQNVANEDTQNINDSPEKFVPMLQGIPKYVEAEPASQQQSYIKGIIQHLKQKPPPSLLRSNMRGQTDVTPHELSTIVEADTIPSSRNTSLLYPQSPEVKKIGRSISPNRDNFNQTVNSEEQKLSPAHILEAMCRTSLCSNIASDSGDYITITPNRSRPSVKERENVEKQGSPSLKSNVNSSQKSTTTTTEDARAKSSMSGVLPLTDSTPDSPDELESMLRKFKLEWAIALVKKTEQALALSSSSSASDVHGNPSRPDKNNSSESYQRICQKLGSSSSLESDKSHLFDLSNHFREFQDLSEIQGAINRSKSQQQRTSTPVQHSKSTDSKKSTTKENLFRNDSELSSVRNSSEDNLFLSIPNLTLNTTNCSLNRAKK